jgi:lipopolysaccharide biosynthesis glycosyltransferase
MSEINVAIAFDKNYIQHASVTLCSLFEHNKNHSFNIYILTEGIPLKDKRKITKFVEKYSHAAYWYIINKANVGHLKISLHISLATYYRLLIPEVLSNVSKVLYLDTDILIKADIGSLWEVNVEPYALAAVQEYAHDASYLGFSKKDAYLNAGVLLMNLDYWRIHNTAKRIIDFISANPDKVIMWDQDGINAELKGKWKELPFEWNQTAFFYETFPATLPVVIHYSGRLKPWDYYCPHPLKGEYYKYLKKTPWKSFQLQEHTVWYFIKKVLKKIQV